MNYSNLSIHSALSFCQAKNFFIIIVELYEYAFCFFDFQDKRNLCFRQAAGCHGLFGNAIDSRRQRCLASVAPWCWLRMLPLMQDNSLVRPVLGCNTVSVASQNRLNWSAIQPELSPNPA